MSIKLPVFRVILAQGSADIHYTIPLFLMSIGRANLRATLCKIFASEKRKTVDSHRLLG